MVAERGRYRLCEISIRWSAYLFLLAESQTETEQKDDAQRASTSSDFEKPQFDMLKVYEDWGDVRYEGDRYRAFCDWWRNRVNTNEQRGAYLFAEPLRGTWTRVLTDDADMQNAWDDDTQIVIALPIHQTRHHANKSLARIVRKHIAEQKGRAVSDPRSSKARYHLNTALHIKGVKLAFDIYDHRNGYAIDAIPQRVSKNLPDNVRIAQAVGLHDGDRLGNDVKSSEIKRTLSTKVARYLRLANSMIETAGDGYFP
jgi:hypothetical protein